MDNDGIRIENLEARLMKWSDYFKELYNQKYDTNIIAINFNIINADLPNNEPLAQEEIHKASMQMNNYLMLKAGEDHTFQISNSSFNKIWSEKKVPKEWAEDFIIPLHKKGSKNKCKNYRDAPSPLTNTLLKPYLPILLSVPSKILSIVNIQPSLPLHQHSTQRHPMWIQRTEMYHRHGVYSPPNSRKRYLINIV